jgi:hypothetical protein
MKYRLEYRIFRDGVWRTLRRGASVEELTHEGEVMIDSSYDDLRVINISSGKVLWTSTRPEPQIPPPAVSSAGRQRRAGKRRSRFEFERKDGQINMRVPRPLLEAVKARAKARGIPYTRFIRETLERAMSAPK